MISVLVCTSCHDGRLPNRVDVVLSRDGLEALRRPAAVLSKDHPDDTTWDMQILVDEALVFHVHVVTEGTASGEMKYDRVWATNKALSDGVRLLDLLRDSDTLAITSADRELFRFDILPGGRAPFGSAIADYAEDVAAIESLHPTSRSQSWLRERGGTRLG
jgi:hypothetical protein